MLSTEHKYCCDKFKEECESDPANQDNIFKEDDGKYYFHFEGCIASFPLIYCPNCGARLEKGEEEEK